MPCRSGEDRRFDSIRPFSTFGAKHGNVSDAAPALLHIVQTRVDERHRNRQHQHQQRQRKGFVVEETNKKFSHLRVFLRHCIVSHVSPTTSSAYDHVAAVQCHPPRATRLMQVIWVATLARFCMDHFADTRGKHMHDIEIHVRTLQMKVGGAHESARGTRSSARADIHHAQQHSVGPFEIFVPIVLGD